jgi:hypothetical protein
MGSNPIICCFVTHWVSTAHGIRCPQPKKALGAFRPLERELQGIHRDNNIAYLLICEL